MSYWIGYSLILIVGLAIFIAIGLFLYKRRKQNKPIFGQPFIENILLSIVVLFMTFMVIEAFFKLFFAQSDGFRYTLASQNWYDRYWEENSLGYRDTEWTSELLDGKIKVMVVGDSFVAGSGIAQPEDRFSNRLGQHLGDDYAILNVASPGWDTLDEVAAIVDYPFRPDILVFSYYINDIEGVAYETGAQRPQIRQDPPDWFLPVVRNSHAINFLYWRLIRLGPQEWATIYWDDWLKKIATDSEILWRQQQELLRLVEGAASEQIPLFVVVFPNLAAVEESEFITQPVIDLFEERNIPVFDVSTILIGRDPSDTMVNSVDSHPNEAINQEVAEKLYEMILACDTPQCQQVIQP